MARNIPKPKAADVFGGIGDKQQEHEYTPTPTPVEVKKPKELRNQRLQLTLFPSLVAALGVYAEENQTTRNQVVEKLIVDLLTKEGYYTQE